MEWHRTTMGRLTADFGVYRAVVARTPDQTRWLAQVTAPDQVYASVFAYPTLHEAQVWAETKRLALLRQPRAAKPS